MRLLKKLLSRNLNLLQLLGFTLANLLGMSIVLVAVQFFFDITPMFQEGDGLLQDTRIVIAKRVNTLRTLTNKPPTFSTDDMEDIRRQPFTKAVNAFVPSQYGVVARVGIESVGATFSTEMFFEAVPDECIDADPSEWKDNPDSDTLPIILPKNYLNLYNFGYAGARGLPTFSEKLVGKMPISLTLIGSNGQWEKTGKVVGFSKRLNTILVPLAFMQRANQNLSHTETTPPSRLIITVDNPADKRIAAYLDGNGYETETQEDETSRLGGMMKWVIAAVLVIGLAITALAFYVLLLSIFLLLQKHTDKIDSLLLIGYTPKRVARFYHDIALWLNLGVLLLSVGLALWVRKAYVARFIEWYDRYEVPSVLPLLLTAVALFAVVGTLNLSAIRRKVLRVWNSHK